MRAALLLLALLLPTALAGQVEPPVVDPVRPVTPAMAADSVPDDPVSPLGAFLRALVLPTWGHGAVGSHRRGAFYMAAEGGTAWMLLKTISRRSSAERVLEAREAVVEARVALADPPEGETPEEYQARLETALEEDPLVDDARRRLDARQGQFEDWVAMGIFLTFLSGADAYVTAHLRDFPDPLDVVVAPAPGGGMQVGAKLYVGALFQRR